MKYPTYTCKSGTHSYPTLIEAKVCRRDKCYLTERARALKTREAFKAKSEKMLKMEVNWLT